MRAGSRAVSMLCVLFLLHFHICSTSSLPLDKEELMRGSWQTRKLLQHWSSNSADLTSSRHAVAKQPEKAVRAGLRKLPPSRSNPTQN